MIKTIFSPQTHEITINKNITKFNLGLDVVSIFEKTSYVIFIKLSLQFNDFIDSLHAQRQKNYYKYIAEHKDITKLTMMLSSAVNSTKGEVKECVDQFEKYMFLWKDDREETIKVLTRIN